MSVLVQASSVDREFAGRLRAAVDGELRRRNLNQAELAEILGLAPVGVTVLFSRTWSLEEAVRVAQAMGLPMELTVGD